MTLTLEEYFELRRRQNLAAGTLRLHTYSRDSFPLDPDPYRDDEWARTGTTASTVRELADPIWGDYCIRHQGKQTPYAVELLDGTPLDLDQPIGDEVGELLSNGTRRVCVRFRQVKEKEA